MPRGGNNSDDERIRDDIDISAARQDKESLDPAKEPKLANRREHKKSVFVAGRTIGEKRERLETKRERAAAREKDKRKNRNRIIIVSLAFIAFIAILIILARIFLSRPVEEPLVVEPEPIILEEPTIEIIDESAASSGDTGKITSRMKTYIADVESDLRNYGIIPNKAVIPAGAIREVDFYLEGYTGFLKTTIDRGAGVTSEDAERMLRYLKDQGVADFEYIDLRIDGRAFWK